MVSCAAQQPETLPLPKPTIKAETKSKSRIQQIFKEFLELQHKYMGAIVNSIDERINQNTSRYQEALNEINNIKSDFNRQEQRLDSLLQKVDSLTTDIEQLKTANNYQAQAINELYAVRLPDLKTNIDYVDSLNQKKIEVLKNRLNHDAGN